MITEGKRWKHRGSDIPRDRITHHNYKNVYTDGEDYVIAYTDGEEMEVKKDFVSF